MVASKRTIIIKWKDRDQNELTSAILMKRQGRLLADVDARLSDRAEVTRMELQQVGRVRVHSVMKELLTSARDFVSRATLLRHIIEIIMRIGAMSKRQT